MRIGVNARFLIKDKMAGLGHYTFEVVKCWVKSHPDDQFVFFFDRPFDEQFVFASNIEAVVLPPPARTPVLFIIWYEMSLRAAIQRKKVDVLFSPDNFMSLRSGLPTLLVIHDLAYLYRPESLSKMQLMYYRYFMPRFARKASRIATVSQTTKRDIVKRFQIDPVKIEVAGLGLNEGIVRGNYIQKEDYFVHVGTIQPRKNVVRLIEAYDRYRDTTGKSTKLIFIGGKGWKDSAFYRRRKQSKYCQDIDLAGYKTNAEISSILHKAMALLTISTFEGFGMPIIEAQHCGCPVIASNVSSLPEASGGAALLVDPLNIDDIADAMRKIVEEEKLRLDLMKRGFENADRYSWSQTASVLYQMLQDIVQGN